LGWVGCEERREGRRERGERGERGEWRGEWGRGKRIRDRVSGRRYRGL